MVCCNILLLGSDIRLIFNIFLEILIENIFLFFNIINIVCLEVNL